VRDVFVRDHLTHVAPLGAVPPIFVEFTRDPAIFGTPALSGQISH
jgi:hypothetical protein